MFCTLNLVFYLKHCFVPKTLFCTKALSCFVGDDDNLTDILFDDNIGGQDDENNNDNDDYNDDDDYEEDNDYDDDTLTSTLSSVQS